MNSKFSAKTLIFPSSCDRTGKLSIPAVFSLFMDVAATHAERIGCGADALAEKDIFWITTKTKVLLHRMPSMMEEVTVETWPEKPGRIRCNRYYLLKKGDEILAEGVSEWAIINRTSGKLVAPIGVYDESFEFLSDTVCDASFEKIGEDFEDCRLIEDYTVRSTDIDLGRHMNNAAYVRALFGAVSCDEIERAAINEVQIVFKSQSFEGEKLTICGRKTDIGAELGILHADGRVAAAVKFWQNY